MENEALATGTMLSLATLDELRQHVHQILCKHDKLDPQQAPLAETLLMRSGRPCGMFFEVDGPRLLKIYAVWAGTEKRILFYDSKGVRFAETRLSKSPDPAALAA